MSKVFRITLDGHQLALSEEADLQELCRTAAKAVIPPSMVPSLRLVLRRETHGTTIEPFLGSASLQALLGIAKKRNEASALLVALVKCTFLFCEHVGIFLVEEGVPLPHERIDLSLTALRGRHRLDTVWYRIVAQFIWFHFAQVEARLLQPLKLSTGELATHYFREFWVCAVEQEIACDVVAAMVAKDAATVIAFGDAALGEPPPSRRRGGGCVVVGGRVYFSDRRH